MAIRGCNHESECRCDEPETVEHYCSTQSVENESDSFSLLKRNLKSILRRTYEEGKHHSPVYFFPQGQISRWFSIQKPKDTVTVKLPLNLFREKKWMGLAVFAIFSVHGNSPFVQNHSFSYQIGSDEDGRHLMKGGLYSSGSFLIPLPLLKFSSHILFVIFKPRQVFPYVQDRSNHFYVSFMTNAARLQVELCGRLVYQHNVKGLIHTSVDCVLKSGQNLYQDYSQKNLRHLLMTYHLPIWNRAHADRPTTSTLTSNDPSRHQSTEELLHQSFQHPLFMESIQDRYEGSSMLLFLEKKSHIFFTSQSMGNEATVRIPERLYFAKCDVGVLVCAVVVTNKQIGIPDKNPKPQSRAIVLDLKCEFGADSHEVEPEHHFFVPAEVLMSQYRTPFIWLFFIPLAAFDVPWSCCYCFRSKVSINNEELFHVEQCGIHLLRTTERKMVDNLLMMSMLPPES